MPQLHHYLLSEGTGRMFKYSDQSLPSISRFDIFEGTGNPPVYNLRHEAPFTLPSTINIPGGPTYHIAKYTAVQPYQDSIFAAATVLNGAHHIFKLDSFGTISSGELYEHNLAHPVLDMTIYKQNLLLWCDGTHTIHSKPATGGDNPKTTSFFNSVSGEGIRALSAFHRASNDEDWIAAASQLDAVPETPPSVSFMTHSNDGSPRGKTGTLKIALKTGDDVFRTRGTSNVRYSNVYVVLHRPITGTNVSSNVAASASIANAEPRGAENSINNHSVADSIILEITLSTANLVKHSTTLQEIADAINNSGDAFVQQFEATVTDGDSAAEIDYGSATHNSTAGLVAYQLGVATSIKPLSGGVPLDSPIFSDFADADRPHDVYVAGIDEINAIHYTKDDFDRWAITNARVDLNAPDSDGDPNQIDFMPTGLALTDVSGGRAGTVYIARADGSVSRYEIKASGGFSTTRIKDGVEVQPTQGSDDTRTRISYEPSDDYLHVNGERIVSIQGTTTATGLTTNNSALAHTPPATIELYDGHDKQVRLISCQSTAESLGRLTGLDITITSGVISHIITDAGSPKSEWLLTTFTSE